MSTPVALVVEDDEILAGLLGIVTELSGFRAETINDGLEASARLKNPDLPDPRLVVLDLHLPGMGGDEILKQIRSDPRLSQTAVVILTADFLAPTVYQPGATGIQPDELLIKPVDNEALQAIFGKYKDGRLVTIA